MELKFTLYEWLYYDLYKNISLLQHVIKEEYSPEHKEDLRISNLEKEELNRFFLDLKDKKRQWEAGKGDMSKNIDELILAPETMFFKKHLIRDLESKLDNKDVYCSLLRNNNIPIYQKLVGQLTGDARREGIYVHYSLDKGGDYHLEIFKHLIFICHPADIQSMFKILSNKYEEVYVFGTHRQLSPEAHNKTNEIEHEFRDSLRYNGPLGNTHANHILFNLLGITDLPHRAIKAVIKHVKELNESHS